MKYRDDDTQIIKPDAREGALWFDESDLKLKQYRNGQWRNVKFRYEDKKYVDANIVGWLCITLAIILLLGVGILVGWGIL